MSRRLGKPARAATTFKVAVALPMALAISLHAWSRPGSVFRRDLLFWTLAVAVTELLPIPTKAGMQLSLSHPLLLAALVLYEPLSAATVAFIGTFDRRELNRTIPAINALFNRAQIALSIFTGSVVFHWLVVAPSGSLPGPMVLVPA